MAVRKFKQVTLNPDNLSAQLNPTNAGFWSTVWDKLTGAPPIPPVLEGDPEVNVEMSFVNIGSMLFGNKTIPITVYNPSSLTTHKGYGVIDKMRRDAQVKVAMNFKKHAILSTGWTVESPQDMDDEWEVTLFVKNVLDQIPGTLTRRLRNILCAMDYGFSLTEKSWKQGDDGKIWIKNLKTRRPGDFTFDIDAFGNIVAVRQQGRMMPVDRFIHYSFTNEFENPYGTSDLESAYQAWWLKDNGYRFLGILLERLGIPPIFATYNQAAFSGNADNLDALKSALTNLQAGSAVMIPRGESEEDVTFWAPEIASAAATVFIPALAHADTDIAKAILMPNLLGATGQDATQKGSNARAQTHFDVFMLVIEAIRDEVAQAVVQEQIIKPLVDLNFSVDEYPTFRFMPFEKKDISDLMTSWGLLVKESIVSRQPEDENFIRDLMEFPEVTDQEKAQAVIDAPVPTNTPAPGDPATNTGTGNFSNRSHPKKKVKGTIDGDANQQTDSSLVFEGADREPTSAEAKVDYAQISSDFDAIENASIDKLREAYSAMRDTLVRFVQKQYTTLGPKIVQEAYITNKQAVHNAMLDLLKTSFTKGQEHLRSELPSKNYAKPISGFAPREATQYLRQKSVTAAATANQRILDKVKQTLLSSLKGQQSPGDAANAISDLFEPYIGSDPAYINTVVRTNMIDAYNQGRLTAMRDPDVADGIAGVQYSAIIDTRTTEICQFLDQMIFKPHDSALDELTPPNHFNCRSVLVPLMIDEAPAPDEFITPDEKAEAIAMKGDF